MAPRSRTRLNCHPARLRVGCQKEYGSGVGEDWHSRSRNRINSLPPDSNWDVRRNAADALVNIGTPEALTALIAALRDSNWDVRMKAAETLGKIGTPEAITALIEALGDSDWDVRRYAAHALRNIGTLDTLKQIISSPLINVYELEIFELVRILVIRYYKEKVPFIPLYPEVIQFGKLKDC